MSQVLCGLSLNMTRNAYKPPSLRDRVKLAAHWTTLRPTLSSICLYMNGVGVA